MQFAKAGCSSTGRRSHSLRRSSIRSPELPSTIAWLDYDEAERQRMREIAGLFRDQGTVDELGLGRIRDAFSNRLFPGTSVLWRRARYLLFVPWVYQLISEGKGPRATADDAARRLFRRLRDSLVREGDLDGLIGRQRPNVQQTPDVILWAALETWGVREPVGTLHRFHRTLDFQARRKAIEEELPPESFFHPRLPARPAGFPDRAAFRLSEREAEFLCALLLDEDALPTLVDGRGDSLLALLMRMDTLPDADTPFWEQSLPSASAALGDAIRHAGCFSDVMHGARVLYAATLAQARNDLGRLDEAEDAASDWIALVDGPRRAELVEWRRDISEFWAIVRAQNPRVDRSTTDFVEGWSDIALSDPAAVFRDPRANDLVVGREAFAKGGRARLSATDNKRREGGGVVPTRLTYRWLNAHQIATDIRRGQGA
jgi:hypothetical protein